jgi:hypothetical protein
LPAPVCLVKAFGSFYLTLQAAMKRIALPSLLLNLALIATVAALTIHYKRSERVSSETQQTSSKPAVSAPQASKFHWSQVESADYATYVSNLRAIGCPEPTIKSIVSDELDALLTVTETPLSQSTSSTKSNNPLQKSVAGSHPSSGSMGSSSTDAPRTENPDTESSAKKAAILASLFPKTSTPHQSVLTAATATPRPGPATLNEADSSAGETPTAEAVAPPVEEAPLPVVMQPLDPASNLQLTPEEVVVINESRGEFIKEINQVPQVPTDPTYNQIWNNARFRSDAVLRAGMGDARFNVYQTSTIQEP